MRSKLLFAMIMIVGMSQLSLAEDPSSRQFHITATEKLLDSSGDGALSQFSEDHLAASYRASFPSESALLTHLREIRDEAGPIGGIGLLSRNGVISLHISNRQRESVVTLKFDPSPPKQIIEIELESSDSPEAGPKVSWDTLESTLEEAEENGFCGSVLVIRDGRVVLERGYGYSDPEQQHRVLPTTLFAIGSTPIDFTHGAILKLEELGKLSLSDPISKYFPNAPTDKRDITLEHLRTGRSGLIDFPGIAGVDENMDLSFIDRAEFMRRIFAAPLLFEPGTDEQHSHCAWGVLSAVIEIASGRSYEKFVRKHFFDPAGMDRTGNYPIANTFPAKDVAVGLGGNTWGDINSPQHWGETSWLVLGSGGMVSTPRDLHRWRTFLASGKALGKAAQRKYGLDGVFAAVGGNDRGFINTIGASGDNLAILCSNSHTEMGDHAAKLGEALIDLVMHAPEQETP